MWCNAAQPHIQMLLRSICLKQLRAKTTEPTNEARFFHQKPFSWVVFVFLFSIFICSEDLQSEVMLLGSPDRYTLLPPTRGLTAAMHTGTAVATLSHIFHICTPFGRSQSPLASQISRHNEYGISPVACRDHTLAATTSPDPYNTLNTLKTPKCPRQRGLQDRHFSQLWLAVCLFCHNQDLPL